MNSWFPGMIDGILQATFLCGLLLFWLCIYHGLRQNERKFITFYLPKLIVILPLYCTAIVLATWEKYNELRDPTYSHFIDTGNYNVRVYKSVLFGVHTYETSFCRHLKYFSISQQLCIYYIYQY